MSISKMFKIFTCLTLIALVAGPARAENDDDEDKDGADLAHIERTIIKATEKRQGAAGYAFQADRDIKSDMTAVASIGTSKYAALAEFKTEAINVMSRGRETSYTHVSQLNLTFYPTSFGIIYPITHLGISFSTLRTVSGGGTCDGSSQSSCLDPRCSSCYKLDSAAGSAMSAARLVPTLVSILVNRVQDQKSTYDDAFAEIVATVEKLSAGYAASRVDRVNARPAWNFLKQAYKQAKAEQAFRIYRAINTTAQMASAQFDALAAHGKNSCLARAAAQVSDCGDSRPIPVEKIDAVEMGGSLCKERYNDSYSISQDAKLSAQ